MEELFETLMLIFFGLSWPISVIKSYRSRTAKGKSILFQYAILLGYICGICGKFVSHNVNYVLILYFINLIMVGIDTFLYYRNRRLDRVRDREEVLIVENL